MAFTKENAGIYSKLALDARWHKPVPDKTQQTSTVIPLAIPVDDGFRNDSLLRVREHIKLLQDRMDDALDGQAIDDKVVRALTDAISKLETVEQRLSNRTVPAAAKTSTTPTKRRQTFAEPIPLSEPGPAVQEAKTCDPFSEVQLPE